ncbi:MAG: twin-arginine translocation signal domain-containing protein, partial [Acidobacteriota bacterium]|nr:twin-arginine translocation signal domain-containing protein [Acidobacteriota bacterium]
MKLNRRNLLKQLGAGGAASSLLAPARSSAEIAGAAQADGGASTAAKNLLELDPIRLDRNENAYGASEKAIAAIQQSASRVSRYEDPNVLRKTIAAHHREIRSGKTDSLNA